MERIRKNNQGYSLVEMIICIGIIAVLSGLAGVTISSIKTARANSAMESFDQEIAALQMRTKSQDKDSAIQIVEADNGKYNVFYGTSSDGVNFTASATEPDVVLEKVDIYYTYNGSEEAKVTSQIFKFNKSDNQTINGYGTFVFYKSGSSTSVGRVTINKSTGSHYFGS